MMIFHWVWLAVWTALVLPFGIALLRGRAPAWLRQRSTVRGIRMRGVACLMLYGSALAPSLLTLTGSAADEHLVLRIVTGPALVLAAIAVFVAAGYADRRDRTR
ncbi:hypothetical protein GCM10020367_19130 [Streptomyces sannanensis]|uniref:Uncharacterized protein n=1 Tax=Streptomyces sannanensis TaxID=285536 RepID=A0ABP6S8X4_9ACTN